MPGSPCQPWGSGATPLGWLCWHKGCSLSWAAAQMCSSQRDGDGCKVGDEPGEHTAAARPHIPVPSGRVPWEIWGTLVSAGWMASR